MRALGVALLSAALLAYEILLVRVFGIEQFHHFASMAIGVAMTGFGAAGVLLALARPSAARTREWLAAAAWLSPALLVLGPAAAHRVPLDATQLLWDRAQWWRLGLLYVALSTPILVGSLAILAALQLEPARPGFLYGASFVGSGLGAALALAILGVLRPDRALATPALLAALAAAALAAPRAADETRRAPGAREAIAGALIVLAALAVARPPWPLAVSPYKELPQVEAFPGARRVAERVGPLGWTVAVEAASFRDAPGLSLGYAGEFPRQTALFVDGEACGAVADWSGAPSALLDWLPSSLAYAPHPRDRVLVLGGGGNTEVWNAAAHGAREITAVELNPEVIGLARNPEPPGAAVRWMAADARSFLARGRERFDLVTLGPAGGLGSSAAGVHALREDFLRTVEAYVACLRRLAPGGTFAATCWLAAPPRESVRLVLTVAEALRRVKPDALPRGLVVCRGWGTVTVLAQPAGFDSTEVASLRRWARGRKFSVDWDPAIAAGSGGPPPRFDSAPHGIGSPEAGLAQDSLELVRAARAATAGPEAATAFSRGRAFAVAPAADARPYPGHFLRAGSVLRLARGNAGRWLPFAEWGPIALFATLVQSAAVAAALMLLPLALRRSDPDRGRLRVSAYFGSIGLGYMAAEIAAIPPLSLLLGHPVYAVSAVLALLLVCSGLGSAWSDRLEGGNAWRIAGVIAMALVLGAFLLLPLAHALAGAALPLRAVAALAVLAPAGLLMGMPFALGLRSLFVRGQSPALAWAANGFASVVAAPLSAIVALEAGTGALLVLAAAGYAAAALVHHASRAPWPGHEVRPAGSLAVRRKEQGAGGMAV
jgi:hypothetical protein